MRLSGASPAICCGKLSMSFLNNVTDTSPALPKYFSKLRS